MNVSPFRFFVTVGLHPAHGLAVLVAVVVIGIWTIAMSASELDSALGMLLFVQMFLASTGFTGRARRGHFDPILASASGRPRVLASHWLASTLPGLAGWVIVCASAWMFGGDVWSPAAMGSRSVALLIVSGLAWTAGLALPRGAGGAMWAAGLLVAMLHHVDFLKLPRGSAAVLCPFLILGTHAPLTRGAIVADACGVGVLLLSVWRLSGRFDLYLRDRA